ncbi:hypothetical protein C1T17_16960 [Sphingobium sp. SCG-1]|uniref:hypothetical protein n=1 Tax=Sphingobium sp. SCG-1 TaxID=2072936 RepID=UPI000CD67F90|nr:hypothetical protein [Sphingobium sp. SCG-1]AUW59515.1 hypothetical protein C1T17_16960 [Sphingobium sp. SCG-1]
MRPPLLLLGTLFIATTATPALAKDEARVTVAVTGGSLGVGPEVAYRATKKIGLRGNATFLSFSQSFGSNDLDYDGKVKLRSGGVMVDIYPFDGGFRISAGGRSNGNKGRVVATPNGPVTINGTIYTPAQVGTLSGKAGPKNFAPMLTVGYGGGIRPGLAFGVDAGAMFQGTVRLHDFTASNAMIRPQDIEAERRDLQDDIDGYKVYPVLQFSLGYRF